MFAKILEKLLKNKIGNYLSDQNLITKSQFGFCKNLSTTDAIMNLCNQISDGFNTGLYTGATFCDISKAFDCVNHELLILKLKQIGFDKSSCQLMRSYLSNRYQYVSIGSEKSSMLKIVHGVPQGSVLGPMLFIIFVNDLPVAFQDTSVLLYADDTNLLNTDINEMNLLRKMDNAQSLAFEWFTLNKLCINNEKTERMIFTLRTLETENPENIKFLGIHLDSTLNWYSHVDTVSKKLTKNIYFLRHLKNNVSDEIIHTVYFATCHSLLSYAVLSWGHAPATTRLFALQRRAVRVVAGLNYRDDCKLCFKNHRIMTLPGIYIYNCLIYTKKHLNMYNTAMHGYETRCRNQIVLNFHRVNRSRNAINYYGPKLFNCLPESIKDLNFKCFCSSIKNFLLEKAFYSVNEYFNCDFLM